MRFYLNLWNSARRADCNAYFLSRLQRFAILWVLTRGNVSSISIKQKGEARIELYANSSDPEAQELCNDLMREHLENVYQDSEG